MHVSGGSFLNSNTFNTVPISNGLFTVQLDYGASTFNGEARWIETAVKCTGDANYITLSAAHQVDRRALRDLFAQQLGAERQQRHGRQRLHRHHR